MTRRVIRFALFVVGVAVTIFGLRFAAWSDIPKELRVSAIPDENPTELVRIYTPFAEYLSKELGIPVRYYNVIDYERRRLRGWRPRNWIWCGTAGSPLSKLASGPEMRSPW